MPVDSIADRRIQISLEESGNPRIKEIIMSAYDREVSKNGSLSARIYEVCAERDGLKGQVRDYERVRRAIGPEQADRILEAAYQQEQVEKEQKWGARSKIRVGAR